MKKTISTILVCVLLVGTLLSLASCEVLGFVFGTYEGETILGAKITYEFSLTEVTERTEGELLGSTIVTEKVYEYKVKENDEGVKCIFLTTSDDDGNSTTVSKTFNSGSDDTGAYIEIDGTRYYSAK